MVVNKTKKFTVTRYTFIGETPYVILLNRETGKFVNQFDTIEEVQAFVGDQSIYFVADANDKQIEGLDSWHGKKMDWERLSSIAQ